MTTTVLDKISELITNDEYIEFINRISKARKIKYPLVKSKRGEPLHALFGYSIPDVFLYSQLLKEDLRKYSSNRGLVYHYFGNLSKTGVTRKSNEIHDNNRHIFNVLRHSCTNDYKTNTDFLLKSAKGFYSVSCYLSEYSHGIKGIKVIVPEFTLFANSFLNAKQIGKNLYVQAYKTFYEQLANASKDPENAHKHLSKIDFDANVRYNFVGTEETGPVGIRSINDSIALYKRDYEVLKETVLKYESAISNIESLTYFDNFFGKKDD